MQADMVTIYFVNSTEKKYEYQPLQRGNPLSVNIEGEFITITDTYGELYYYPAITIDHLHVIPHGR